MKKKSYIMTSKVLLMQLMSGCLRKTLKCIELNQLSIIVTNTTLRVGRFYPSNHSGLHYTLRLDTYKVSKYVGTYVLGPQKVRLPNQIINDIALHTSDVTLFHSFFLLIYTHTQ
jgi:hypothetical protein